MDKVLWFKVKVVIYVAVSEEVEDNKVVKEDFRFVEENVKSKILPNVVLIVEDTMDKEVIYPDKNY